MEENDIKAPGQEKREKQVEGFTEKPHCSVTGVIPASWNTQSEIVESETLMNWLCDSCQRAYFTGNGPTPAAGSKQKVRAD